MKEIFGKPAIVAVDEQSNGLRCNVEQKPQLASMRLLYTKSRAEQSEKFCAVYFQPPLHVISTEDLNEHREFRRVERPLYFIMFGCLMHRDSSIVARVGMYNSHSSKI